MIGIEKEARTRIAAFITLMSLIIFCSDLLNRNHTRRKVEQQQKPPQMERFKMATQMDTLHMT